MAVAMPIYFKYWPRTPCTQALRGRRDNPGWVRGYLVHKITQTKIFNDTSYDRLDSVDLFGAF